jgi:peptidoglycan hydrolase-like protein with peptidoglycan-binding domain
MKKVIKLTESDLEQIVKRVIKEQSVIGAPNYGVIDWKGKQDYSKNNLPSGVVAVQKALIRKGYDVGKKGADGDFGPATKSAVIKFQKDNSIKQTGNVGPITAKALGVQPLTSNTSKVSTALSNAGFILIWAFPEYEPKVDGKGDGAQLLGTLVRLASGGGKEGTYGKLGHGGCVIIKSNGDATCYEFGRYPGAKKGYGKVLTHPLGNVAKIKDGKLLNAKQIATLARKETFPPGPTMSMTIAVVKLPNPSKAIEYASVKQREYSAADFSIGDDANCGTFARDVAYYGGVETGSFCFPTPIAVVNSFKDKSDNFFQI